MIDVFVVINICIIMITVLLARICSLHSLHSLRTGGKSEVRPRRVAVIHSAYIPENIIRERFSAWDIITDRYPNRADFVYSDGDHLFNPLANKIRARLKCRLDAPIVYDKALLHDKLMKSAPHTICKTYILNEERIADPIFDDSAWIVRSNWGWGGRGNTVVTNRAEMLAAYKRFLIPDASLTGEYAEKMKLSTQIIASEYIRRPMLYHGFKFHLRIYIIVGVMSMNNGNNGNNNGNNGNTTLKVWVKNSAVIAPAALPYIDADYDNELIHDTHMKRNPSRVGLYPDDLPEADPARVNAVMRDVFSALTPHIGKYPEARSAYDVYGIDLMLTQCGDPKLIEINRYPAFPGNLATLTSVNFLHDWKKFDIEIFDAILETVFADEFSRGSASRLTTRLI